MIKKPIIRVKKASEEEVNKIFQRLPARLRIRFFECAFNDERNQGYRALPPTKRSYYLIEVNGRDEALFGINFTPAPGTANISSFGRIIEKDSYAAEGWQYLKTMFEQRLLFDCREKGINRIVAKLKSKGGWKAFKDLESSTYGKYKIVLFEDPYRTGTGSAVIEIL